MTENTPYGPCSKKGEIRAKIATALMKEVQAGSLSAMIARSADCYGPDTQNGVPNVLLFEPFAKGATASWLVNAAVPHSLTFTPDAARGVAVLAGQESAWNQVWHLPTAPNPPTGGEFIAMAANEFGVAPKYRVLSRPMLRVAGWFNPQVRESNEMLYQSDSPYLFDSTKLANESCWRRHVWWWLPGMDSNHELDKILECRNLLILKSRSSRQKRQKQVSGTKSVQKVWRRKIGSIEEAPAPGLNRRVDDECESRSSC